MKESKKRRHIFRHLLFIALLIGAVVCLRPMLSHHSPPGAAKQARMPHRLTVMTWNTGRMGGFVKPEKNEVLQYLLEQDADVVCLQEVDVYKDAKYLTLDDVKNTLRSKYRYSYIDFAVYNKRHQYGTMVWSKYPLINKQTIRYESKGNISNQCDIVVGSDTLRLINNHLESYKFTAADLDDMEHMRAKWEKSTPLRNQQARVVREMIDSSPYPVIVTGDFNAIPLSFTYRHISKHLHDAWLETSWFQWGATCEKRGIGIRIDYILSSDPLIPLRCSIKKTTGSDHRPVEAVLAW